MFSKRYDSTKLKLNLKLAITRLQMLQKKKENLSIMDRKKIAEDLGRAKEDLARVRVEQVIRDDYLIEAYEILEMFCSLLSTRFGLIDSVKECDRGIEEAVTTIMWASARVHDEVPELRAIAENLSLRYGKPFTQFAMENQGNMVNQRVIHKLSISTPQEALVNGYLVTIASKYGVSWAPPEHPAEGNFIDTPCSDCAPPLVPDKRPYLDAFAMPGAPSFAPEAQYPPQPPLPFNAGPSFTSTTFAAPPFAPAAAPPPRATPPPQPRFEPPPPPSTTVSTDGPSFEELNRRFELLKQQK